MRNKIKLFLCLTIILSLIIPVIAFAENEDPFIRSIKPNTAKTAIMVYEEEDPYIRNTRQYTAIKMLEDEDPYIRATTTFDWFTHIKYYYDQGYYTEADVRVFVEKGKITPEQYTEITGQPY